MAGSPLYYYALLPPGLCCLLLALLPTDAVIIRIVTLAISILCILISLGVAVGTTMLFAASLVEWWCVCAVICHVATHILPQSTNTAHTHNTHATLIRTLTCALRLFRRRAPAHISVITHRRISQYACATAP